MGFFPSMNSFMNFTCLSPCKCFTAVFTSKRLFSGMNNLMRFHITGTSETFTTNLALKWFFIIMRSFMFLSLILELVKELVVKSQPFFCKSYVYSQYYTKSLKLWVLNNNIYHYLLLLFMSHVKIVKLFIYPCFSGKISKVKKRF